jgi:SAM-dependent methyltransferase
MNEARRFYDLNARRYADEWYANDLMLPSVEDFLSLFPAAPRILDLGCGPGNESRRLARGGAVVVGLDFSGESIKIAREMNPGLSFVEADFASIGPELGAFDGVFACASLIHLEAAALAAVLERIWPILRPGGYFLAIYRQGEGPIVSRPEIAGESLVRIVQQYTRPRLRAAFEAAGFLPVRDGYLDGSLRPAWDSQLFRKP